MRTATRKRGWDFRGLGLGWSVGEKEVMGGEGSMKVGPAPPPHIFPTVSPVPTTDRARHRTRNHMVTTGRLVVSSELRSLPRSVLKPSSPLPP